MGKSEQQLQRQRIGEAVRRIREQRGLTVYALSRISGLSTGHLWEIEAGEYDPRMGTLMRLAASLNCDVADFLSP